MKQYTEQSQLNAILAYHRAGYSALAIGVALNLTHKVVYRCVRDSCGANYRFGKKRLPSTWTKQLEPSFPSSYVPNLKGVYHRFLKHMALCPDLQVDILTQLLRPCTFPPGQLQEWLDHYRRYRSLSRHLSALHFRVMKEWAEHQQTLPPSSAPAPCDKPPQTAPAVLGASPQPPPAVSA